MRMTLLQICLAPTPEVSFSGPDKLVSANKALSLTLINFQ